MKIVTDKILGNHGALIDKSKNYEVLFVYPSSFPNSCCVAIALPISKFGRVVDATVECLDDEGYPL